MYLLLIFSFFISANCFSALPVNIVGKNLMTSQETKVSFLSNEKKGTVVFFLSTTCPCSITHFEHFKDLANRFKNIEFVGIHSNNLENLADAREVFKQQKANFLILQDEKSTLANLFGAVKTPQSYLVDSKGQLQFAGGPTNSSNFKKSSKKYLEDALLSISQGKIPDISKSRPLGCSISR